MTVRERIPRRLHSVLRDNYIRLGTATSGLRLEPEFMVIGAQRSGTTSLFKALAEHPQVQRPPVNKGTDYYTLYSDRGPSWYRGHFPVEAVARRRAGRVGRPVVFEACTYYLFHPFAVERIARDYPGMKLVVMLRDPVERAFSAYKHELGRGFEWEDSFERALDLEDERLVGEVERMGNDPGYESFAHRHHAYRARGQYAEQLERVFRLFPIDQVHVLDSETFFREPAKEHQRLLDFLGLESVTPSRFDQHNARPSAPMLESTRRALEEYYAPHEEALTALLGRSPGWTR